MAGCRLGYRKFHIYSPQWETPLTAEPAPSSFVYTSTCPNHKLGIGLVKVYHTVQKTFTTCRVPAPNVLAVNVFGTGIFQHLVPGSYLRLPFHSSSPTSSPSFWTRQLNLRICACEAILGRSRIFTSQALRWPGHCNTLWQPSLLVVILLLLRCVRLQLKCDGTL